jgi:hypothetical protein
MLCLNKHVINNKQINAGTFRKFIIVIQKHDFTVIFTLINIQSFADYITLVHVNCVLKVLMRRHLALPKALVAQFSYVQLWQFSSALLAESPEQTSFS